MLVMVEPVPRIRDVRRRHQRALPLILSLGRPRQSPPRTSPRLPAGVVAVSPVGVGLTQLLTRPRPLALRQLLMAQQLPLVFPRQGLTLAAPPWTLAPALPV